MIVLINEGNGNIEGWYFNKELQLLQYVKLIQFTEFLFSSH